MKFKPDENMMVAYLYGELNPDEREKVEDFLQKNPDSRQEYERLLSLRKLLGQLPDQEVPNPMIVSRAKEEYGNHLIGPFIRKLMAVAAVFLVLMVAGKLTDTTFSWNNSSIYLGFGGNDLLDDNSSPTSANVDEVNQMISSAFTRFKANELDSISQESVNLINGLMDKNKENQIQQMEKYTLMSKKLMESHYQDLAGQNREILEEFLLMASHQQAAQTQALLNQFAQGLQEMREEDLVYLQTRLNLIEEDKNQFQYETGKVLSDLIYHAANQERQ